MDLSASLFGLTLFVIGLIITYQWGIRPEREQKKRRAERAHGDRRRRQYQRVRTQTAQGRSSVSSANSGPLPRGSN